MHLRGEVSENATMCFAHQARSQVPRLLSYENRSAHVLLMSLRREAGVKCRRHSSGKQCRPLLYPICPVAALVAIATTRNWKQEPLQTRGGNAPADRTGICSRTTLVYLLPFVFR